MILSVQFQSYGSAWKELTDEQYAELRVAIPVLPEKKRDAEYGTFLVDDDGLRAAAKFKLVLEIHETSDQNTMLVKLQNRIDQVEQQSRGNVHQFSDRVQITIPDLGLLYIDEVTHMDDACTDTLQDKLDDGWRILAVCPPNAQRRPDYILGRRKK